LLRAAPEIPSRLGGINGWMAAASLAAALGASAWILSRSGGSLESIALVSWSSHVLAAAVMVLEVLARGMRLVCVARGLGHALPLRAAVRAQLAGDSAAALTPARAGSDPAKLAVLHRNGVRAGPCGALLLGEMWAESLVLIACATSIALFADRLRWVALGLLGYAAIVSLASLAALALLRAPSSNDPPRGWSRLRLGAERWQDARRAIAEFRIHAKRLSTLPAFWTFGVALATVVHIAARLAVLPILALPLFTATEVTDPPLANVVLEPFFVLYATALLPPPGGGGGVEVTFAAVLGDTLGPAAVAATVVWWRVYTFYLSAALGAIALLFPRRSRVPPIPVHARGVTEHFPLRSPIRDLPTRDCVDGPT
jgi:uncharacterized membrane protein YbhN (UPF0104 family)